MPDVWDIQDRMDEGRGREAEVLGQPHDVYRIGLTAAGNYVQASNKVLTQFLAYFKPQTRRLREALEVEKMTGIVYYDLHADGSQLKIGDVLICTDTIYGAGHTRVSWPTIQLNGFTIVQHSPVKPFIGVRVNRLARIYRQSVDPESGHWNPTSDNARPLVLSGGVFGLGAVDAEAALIPIGLNSISRPYGDRLFNEIPGVTRTSGWNCYVPPLRGFQFREGDRIITDDDARYVVSVPFSQETGTCGAQLFLERQTGQEG